MSFGGKVLGTTTYDDGVRSGYVKHIFDVVATSTTTRVSFTSNVSALYGPLLGEVSVVASTS